MMCTVCSLNISETLFHVIFECPAYDIVRNSILRLVEFPMSTDDLLPWTKRINQDDLKTITIFLEKVLELREEMLNEFLYLR
jgi:hypothetical protein